MKKLLTSLLLLAGLALASAQVNTNPPPSGINGLENTVFGYFTAFNTNLVTFRLNRFDLWTGATAMQGSTHPLLNDLAGSYDLWRPTPSTSSAVQTAISLECVTRNEGVMGSLISVQGGLGLSAILWDVKTTLYLDGGSYLDPLAVGEHWDSRLFGEVGVRFKKALGQNFYAGVGLGAQFPKNNQLLSAFAGLTF